MLVSCFQLKYQFWSGKFGSSYFQEILSQIFVHVKKVETFTQQMKYFNISMGHFNRKSQVYVKVFVQINVESMIKHNLEQNKDVQFGICLENNDAVDL